MATGVGPPNANRCAGDERGEDPQHQQPPVHPPRAIKQPLRGGYECEFVQRPPSGLVQADCPVCLLVLREPHQVTCCGYSYCQSCIERIQNTQKLCPTCNKEFDTFADKRLKRSLYALKVYCSQRDAGCDWVGELLELDRHLNLQPPPEKLLVGCQFSEVDCTYCVQPFQRRVVQAHQSDDCPKRPYACEHCSKYAATFKATYEEVTLNHWPVCPFFPLTCPNKCDVQLVLQHQEVEHHLNHDCPLTVVRCDFSIVGCQVQLSRRDMPSHISENLTGHMSLLQVHMMTHPGENMATYLWLMVGSIQKVVVENANIRSELHDAKEDLQQTCKTLQGTQDELRGTQDELRETREKLRESKETVVQLKTSQNEMIATLAKDLQEARERTAQLEASGAAQQEQLRETRDQLQQSRREGDENLRKAQKEVSTKLTASEHRMQTTLNAHLMQQKHELMENLSASEQKMQTQVATLTQTSTDLQATVTAHRKETSAAQHILDLYKRESDEKMKEVKDELSKNLTASERKMQTALNAQQATLTQQKHELTKLSASEQKLQAALATQQTTITKCRDENRRLQQSLTEQERKQLESEAKLTTVKDDLTRKITASEQKIQTQEATLNQHQKTLEKVTYTGTLPFEFTMTRFKQHKRASDGSYSPPFYTHTHGYRMCIRVDANGCGSGEKTSLSVFGYLMQGDFDDDLQWPFQGAITIQLLNQLEDSNHHTYIINFSGSSCNIRVTSGKLAAGGYGNLVFLPHTLLGFKPDRNCQYLKDNQLKFRVSKATNLHPTARIHRRCLALEGFAGAIEPQICVAPIEFTLSDFQWLKKQNDVWHSPAFYTHPQGYRMCVKVYANGSEDGHQTHVSIFTCIMRGIFDGGLKWPFRGDVTIQIVNQAGEDNHQEEVIPYTDGTPDSNAGRVTSEERSLAWGFDEFLPHSSLGYNAARNTQYLRGDSLRIRISKIELKN